MDLWRFAASIVAFIAIVSNFFNLTRISRSLRTDQGRCIDDLSDPSELQNYEKTLWKLTLR